MKSLFRYSALVFGLIYGLFLLLMAADTFGTGFSWRALAGFLTQIIPAVVVLLSLLLGFYKPKYGFPVFLVIAVAFTIFFRTYMNIQNFIVISLPLLIISTLLFFSIKKRKK